MSAMAMRDSICRNAPDPGAAQTGGGIVWADPGTKDFAQKSGRRSPLIMGFAASMPAVDARGNFSLCTEGSEMRPMQLTDDIDTLRVS